MVRYFHLLTAILLAAALVPGARAQGKPAGQVINLTGAVEVRRSGQAPAKAGLLFQLQPGDTLVVPARGAAEVVLFGTGDRFSLAPSSTARVTESGLAPVSGTPPKKLARLALNVPVGKSGTKIMGLLVRDSGKTDGGGPSKPAPAGAVRELPVVLHWAGPVDAEKLEVRVKDAANKTLHQVDLPRNAREYPLPESLLSRGEVYTWAVTAVLADGTAAKSTMARFRVLLPEERQAIEAVERQAEDAWKSEPKNPAPLVLLADAYEKLDLNQDALETYQRVLELAPEAAGVQEAIKRLSKGR